jgi:hypothetical protein
MIHSLKYMYNYFHFTLNVTQRCISTLQVIVSLIIRMFSTVTYYKYLCSRRGKDCAVMQYFTFRFKFAFSGGS